MGIAVTEKMQHGFAEVALTPEERSLVSAWSAVLDGEIEAMARRYYEHLKTTDVGHFLTPDRYDQLLAARIAHWRLLTRGEFDAIADDYTERFGRRLFEVGFPLRIFVVATDWFVVEITHFVDRCPDIPDALRAPLRIALSKFAFLDLLLAHASREVAYLD